MRVVIDTNVFISAGMREGSSPSLAVRGTVGRHFLLKSRATEQELFITLNRPRLAPMISTQFRGWLSAVLAAAESVEIAERIAACRDPKDDNFLRWP